MKFYHFVLGFGLLIFSCSSVHAQNINSDSLSIIPKPVQYQRNAGRFIITPSTKIVIQAASDSLLNEANYLAKMLETATWKKPEITQKLSPGDSAIVLQLDDSSTCYFNKEAYNLTVAPNQIKIKAPSSTGIFYGIQTLRQLLPAPIEDDDPTLVPRNISWSVPAVEVNDYPRYAYRGMHLDVSRHFFPVSFIKKYLDLMALYKMNRFHWHLTDDQGWRIQIKKYPKLTDIGAWRDSTLIGHYGSNKFDNRRYGGFYTQDEIKEVVAYAKRLHITIIPEIEMPGHASAAIAAYPELSCQPEKDYNVKTTWGIFEDIYCPSEKTFTFLENVLTEVMKLFPGKYIHIGGDETPKTAWEKSALAQQVIKREGLKNEDELQSYFINRIEKFLNAHDRQIIGWDEILQGGLAPNATVMSWRGIKGGIQAAKQHHNVIMTPDTDLYLNFAQANPKTEPLAQSEERFITLKDVYSYEPVPDTLNSEEAKYIIGAQANMWSEYIHSGKKVEYMAYPRTLALAEVLWSPKNKRNWDDFWRRLQSHFKRLDILGVNVAKHYYNNRSPFSSSTANKTQ